MPSSVPSTGSWYRKDSRGFCPGGGERHLWGLGARDAFPKEGVFQQGPEGLGLRSYTWGKLVESSALSGYCAWEGGLVRQHSLVG